MPPYNAPSRRGRRVARLSPLSTLHTLQSLPICIARRRKKISPEIRGDFYLVSAVYRLPLSYGMPSAFGALERLEVKASTIREVMYGSMLYTPDGMFMFARNGKPE